ncbi:hypothetical protein FVEG_11147 [Fusarium verticillioides 7600]|uniref:Uncharacterized protein n=1 Tax=Gibberella moniliformis (strain M3125 / FGSC 7600) TaxID=334819 RepID=W7MMU3_GIBM7|nr:hypothetical protein FVEG_11147 [Fusarium verticillioides 7600]EWG52381.1 hypothetical protein FVEG_11147 [Fusarium verticillioides 7600]
MKDRVLLTLPARAVCKVSGGNVHLLAVAGIVYDSLAYCGRSLGAIKNINLD